MERILVVDDDKDALELYRLCLEREGREIVTFYCPDQALEALQKERFDVVVTDIQMPKKDGFSLIRESSAHTEPSTAYIVVTAYGTDESILGALKNDCFGYLNKPFDWNYLSLLVDKAIKAGDRLRRQSAQ